MTDDQLIKNAQNPYLYGKFLDVGAAFNKGLVQASKFNRTQITDPTKAVKNNYEDQLQKYLNKLPADVDLGGVPDKYRNSISNFLMTQKQNYVNLANQVNEYEVGSEMYMDITNQMNQIRSSFETLNSQMKLYGANKKEIIGSIQNQSTSLSPENQANVNLLRSVYNEEFDLSIDEYGNVSFAGDDGVVSLNNLPGYEVKDYKLAQGMLKMGDQVYNAGVVLQPGGIKYNQYLNQLTIGIDQGGRNSLMSVVYDGLIGGVRMIDDPMVAQNVEAYQSGNISFEDLRDIVVNKYMDALVKNSRQGYNAKRPKASTTPDGGGDTSGLNPQQVQLVRDMKSAKNDDGSRKYTEIEIFNILEKMKAGEDVRYTGDMTRDYIGYLSSPEYKTDTKDPYSGDIEEINPYAKYKVK